MQGRVLTHRFVAAGYMWTLSALLIPPGKGWEIEYQLAPLVITSFDHSCQFGVETQKTGTETRMLPP